MLSKRISIGLGLLILLAGIDVACGQQYDIKFDYIAPKGVERHVRLDARVSSTVSPVPVTQPSVPVDAPSESISLEGTFRVIDTEGGKGMRVEYTIANCTIWNNRQPIHQQLLPQGAVLGYNGQGRFELVGSASAPPKSDALTVAIKAHAESCTVGRDVMFGSDKPHQVGDTWPVSIEAIVRGFKESGFDITPKTVTGEVKLNSANKTAGGYALTLSAEANITDLRGQLGTVDVRGGKSRYTLPGTFSPTATAPVSDWIYDMGSATDTSFKAKDGSSQPITFIHANHVECHEKP